jgi:L-malate glycosyltransferase
MRIVLSNASVNWGGVHRVTEVLARGLQARGHDVVVFGRPGSMLEERMRGAAPFEPVLRGLDLHPPTLWRAARALRRHRAQVVLALMKKDVRLTSVAARAVGVPVVMRHNHEQPLPGGLRGRLLYGGAAMHVTNAEATRRVVLASAPWLRAERVEVIYNGIDATRYAGAQPVALGTPAGAVRFGFVANFDRRKGVAELARAWWRVAEAVPAAHLVIAGKGLQEARFREMLAGAPRVHWLGYRRDVPNVLAALDVLVLPSHLEGAPNVVLEAMSSRIAVLATAVSGTPELVRDGLEARLIPPRDADALAAAMVELANDAGLRARLAAAGHERVLKEFTIEGMIDRYEDLFARVARKD